MLIRKTYQTTALGLFLKSNREVDDQISILSPAVNVYFTFSMGYLETYFEQGRQTK